MNIFKYIVYRSLFLILTLVGLSFNKMVELLKLLFSFFKIQTNEYTIHDTAPFIRDNPNFKLTFKIRFLRLLQYMRSITVYLHDYIGSLDNDIYSTTYRRAKLRSQFLKKTANWTNRRKLQNIPQSIYHEK